MSTTRVLIAGALLLGLQGCGPEAPAPGASAPPQAGSVEPQRPAPAPQAGRYEALRAAILDRKAEPAQVREALADPHEQGLANTLHALYLMGDRPWVRELLAGLWEHGDTGLGAQALERIGHPGVRIALASTLARLHPQGRGAYVAYMREAAGSAEPFVRAQAAVALGFTGAPDDVPRVAALARDGDDYVARSAVKALALHGSIPARAALLELRADPSLEPGRSMVVRQMLVEAYPEVVEGAGKGRLRRRARSP